MQPPGTASLPDIDQSRARLARDHPGWHAAHIISGFAFLLSLGGPITPLELAGAPLMLVTALRLPHTWRLYAYPEGGLFRQPVMLAVLAWLGWALLAFAWSPDRAHALDEFGSVRWLWVPIALWPVLDRRLLFVVALCLGMVGLHASQATQWLANRFGWESLDFDHYPDRISGWNAPVVCGSLLTAMLGVHLGPALLLRGGLAWVARGAAGITLVALIATGTRGAWIAAAALIGLAVLVAVRRRSRAGVRTFAVLGVLALPVLIGGWFVVGDGIRSRVDEASREINAVLTDANYHTSTGGRIIMWKWAGEAVAARPITGIGTGGYQAWVNGQQAQRGIDPKTQRVLAHAHGTLIHIAAVQGVIGLALAVVVIAAAFRTRFDGAGTYGCGLGLGLLGLLLAGVFDSVHINAQTSAMLAVLITLRLPARAGP
ncbi:MAG: O-antigen ligase family protein [Planctomycetota bacterium]